MENNKRYWRTFKTNGAKLAKALGYGSLKSFDDLYKGGTVNVFGNPMDSVSKLKIYTNSEDKVSRVEVNVKYFTITTQVDRLNDKLEEVNGMTFGECLDWLKI
tara:strand:+ start:5277 stop:5585 length:309 start_codon:yes stop_codon:yes gene_type:complete